MNEPIATAKCVGELRLTPVVAVAPGTTLAAAARVMARTGAAFVVVEGTDRVLARDDLVRALATALTEDAPPPEYRDDVVVHARSTLLVVGRATPAIAVLGELVRSGGPGAIVVDEQRQPCGTLRVRDLVAALLDDLAFLTGLRHVLHVDTRLG
jgi:CBS domain-containing protein